MLGVSIAIAGFVSAMIAGYAHYLEPRRFRVRTVEVPAPQLTRDLTILHLTDFHLRSDRHWQNKIGGLIEMLKPLRADLVLFSGDFLEKECGIPLLEAILKQLPAPSARYAIWGNHDYYHYTFYHLFAPKVYRGIEWDRGVLKGALRAAGVVILDNTNAVIPWGDAQVVIIGVNDFYAQKHDIPKAFEGAPATGLRILLTHSPELITVMSGLSVDLVLAGHTHGGQITLPGFGPLASRSELPRRKICGVYQHNGSTVIINNGLGEGRFIPFRLLTPPEVVLITLKSDAAK